MKKEGKKGRMDEKKRKVLQINKGQGKIPILQRKKEKMESSVNLNPGRKRWKEQAKKKAGNKKVLVNKKEK